MPCESHTEANDFEDCEPCISNSTVKARSPPARSRIEAGDRGRQDLARDRDFLRHGIWRASCAYRATPRKPHTGACISTCWDGRLQSVSPRCCCSRAAASRRNRQPKLSRSKGRGRLGERSDRSASAIGRGRRQARIEARFPRRRKSARSPRRPRRSGFERAGPGATRSRRSRSRARIARRTACRGAIRARVRRRGARAPSRAARAASDQPRGASTGARPHTGLPAIASSRSRPSSHRPRTKSRTPRFAPNTAA